MGPGLFITTTTLLRSSCPCPHPILPRRPARTSPSSRGRPALPVDRTWGVDEPPLRRNAKKGCDPFPSLARMTSASSSFRAFRPDSLSARPAANQTVSPSVLSNGRLASLLFSLFSFADCRKRRSKLRIGPLRTTQEVHWVGREKTDLHTGQRVNTILINSTSAMNPVHP